MDRKSFCQLYDIFQTYVSFASLYATNVIAMQARPFG